MTESFELLELRMDQFVKEAERRFKRLEDASDTHQRSMNLLITSNEVMNAHVQTIAESCARIEKTVEKDLDRLTAEIKCVEQQFEGLRDQPAKDFRQYKYAIMGSLVALILGLVFGAMVNPPM